MNGADEFNCICNVGFNGKRCEIDLCDSLTCENGFCDSGSCTCYDGYINMESICVETCDLNPCEVLYLNYQSLSLNSIEYNCLATVSVSCDKPDLI